MSTLPTKKSTDSPAKPGRATWGALALSVLIHGSVLMVVGGYVIVEKIIPKKSFVEVEVGIDNGLDEAVMAPEADPADQPETPQVVNEMTTTSATGAEGEAATPSDILVSTATQQAFSLPPAVGAPSTTMPVLGSGTGAGQQGTGSGGGGKGAGPGGLRSLGTLFGSRGGGNETLVGQFYDLKQDPKGKDTPMSPNAPGDNGQKDQLFVQAVAKFLDRWDENDLKDYYRARNALHTTQIFIPTMQAAEAPKAFDVDRDVRPTRWLVHYKGQFVAPKSGNFRFVGCGDDILAVRLDRKLVLNGSIMEIPGQMGADREQVGRVRVGTHDWSLMGGEWFRLSAGRSYPIEILMGEVPGIDLAMFLLIQEKGVEYPSRPGNAGPVLPVFQTAPTKLPKFDEESNGPTVAKEGFAGNPG
ncbi:MAG: hypothetical protein SFU85_11880 [Candidatus Methylacidiphilales bacterium]|nr:hypothetical protein [Candidatus Methylacidiphilales bacterium]